MKSAHLASFHLLKCSVAITGIRSDHLQLSQEGKKGNVVQQFLCQMMLCQYNT